MRPPRWTAAVSAVALLAACSSTPGDSSAPEPTAGSSTTSDPSPTPAPTSDADDGDEPPTAAANDALDGLTGRQLDGGTFDGSAVSGDVVVWFWAPW